MWICVCVETETRIWWREYTYLIMQGYGHDESAPTPGGVFAPYFVGERWYFAECSPRNWQTVRSRRGRFIAPAYMKTPTKWQTEMRVRWCGNVYLIRWKHVFGNVDMRVRWNGNMYLMTWIHVFDNVEMCVRWCECTYLVMRICIFDNVRIRARWIGPYA